MEGLLSTGPTPSSFGAYELHYWLYYTWTVHKSSKYFYTINDKTMEGFSLIFLNTTNIGFFCCFCFVRPGSINPEKTQFPGGAFLRMSMCVLLESMALQTPKLSWIHAKQALYVRSYPLTKAGWPPKSPQDNPYFSLVYSLEDIPGYGSRRSDILPKDTTLYYCNSLNCTVTHCVAL